MELVFFITGFVLGGFIIYLINKNKNNEALNNFISKNNQLEIEKVKIEERFALFLSENQTLKKELESEREKLSSADKRLAKAEETFKSMQEKIALSKIEMEDLNKKFTTEFENIANRLLDEKSKKFTEQNKNNLDYILNPLKEKIKDFEEKVEKAYKIESDERITLKSEIKNLVELNGKISQEANNLAKALKGDNKKQGNWGEFILEKILEKSGLIKDVEYSTQLSTQNMDGKKIQPDVIINLPDNKHIIIDSKVSLLAFDLYANSENEEEREKAKKEHVLSLKNHIKSLSEKNYQTAQDLKTPDFVLLFVPIESSFSMAIQADQELFNYAWERQIVMVSPSTLLATLKTIASIWKQEKQTKNALEIAEQSGKLYDKFVGFVEDMHKIGEKISGSQSSFDEAMKKLSTGHGNLIRRAENIRLLGAKNTKNIPEKLINKEDNFMLDE